MTTRDCTCGKPTSADAYLCDDCTDKLARIIKGAPAVADELDLTLSKQRRFETQTASARAAEHALPYDVAASNALHKLRAQLNEIVDHCISSRVRSSDYIERHPGDSIDSISHWLSWRTDGITAQPWAVDALRQLTAATARAVSVIDRPPSRTYAGPCESCTRDLYATAGRRDVTCRDCGITYDLAARREYLLRAVDDRLATATEIARALTSLELPVTTDRIWQWKHRERIDVRGHDQRGHPLYRVGDIVTLLVEHKQRIEDQRTA